MVEDDDDTGVAGSLMKGRVKAGEKGPWCHRLGARYFVKGWA